VVHNARRDLGIGRVRLSGIESIMDDGIGEQGIVVVYTDEAIDTKRTKGPMHVVSVVVTRNESLR
jgi:hypothetical protein